MTNDDPTSNDRWKRNFNQLNSSRVDLYGRLGQMTGVFLTQNYPFVPNKQRDKSMTFINFRKSDNQPMTFILHTAVYSAEELRVLLYLLPCRPQLLAQLPALQPWSSLLNLEGTRVER